LRSARTAGVNYVDGIRAMVLWKTFYLICTLENSARNLHNTLLTYV
jgi:hypothetical protein